MTKEQALHQFWSKFGYPAFEENSVKVGTPFPYITYQVATDSFNRPVSLTASIWDKKKDGYSAMNANSKKTEEIAEYIGRGGCFENGMWILKGSPFAQSMGDTADKDIRRKVLNITVEFLSEV